MTEIDTAEIRASYSSLHSEGRVMHSLCDEIDRLRAQWDHFNKLATDHHEEMKAQLATARAEALEEAALKLERIADGRLGSLRMTGQSSVDLKAAANELRALASVGLAPKNEGG